MDDVIIVGAGIGGLTLGPVAGWQLDYSSDPAEGLRMKFTPANGSIDQQE